MKEKSKAIKLYLILIFAVCYGLGVIEFFTGMGKAYKFLGIGLTFFPLLSALITRRITSKKSTYFLSLKVWMNKKIWLLSAVAPGILIVLGSVLYFLLFRNEYSGVFAYGRLIGNDDVMIVDNIFVFAIVFIIAAALMIPIQLIELGEEIGWRGYLLSLQAEKYGRRKAVLINGFEWGLSHLPLIYFGFNYSLDNFGAPWTNMLMMILVCMVFGTLFSYVTIKTGNCMYAAIMHGVVNTIGEMPVLLTYDINSTLLGPNPTGIIGMSFLLIAATLFFLKIEKKRN